MNENIIVIKHVMCVLYHCDTACYFFLISESFSGFSDCPLLQHIFLQFLRLNDETYIAQDIWWGNLHVDKRIMLKRKTDFEEV